MILKSSRNIQNEDKPCVGALSSCAGTGIQPCLPSCFFCMSFVSCHVSFVLPCSFPYLVLMPVCLFAFEKLGLALEPRLALNWSSSCRAWVELWDCRDEQPRPAFFAFASCVSHSSSSHLILALFYLFFLIPNHSFFFLCDLCLILTSMFM